MEDENKQIGSIAGNVDTQKAGSEQPMVRQHTLPESQIPAAECTQNEVPQIINKIVSIAREIGWLSDRKVPVESDSDEPVSQAASR